MNKFKDRPPLPSDWTLEHVRTLRGLARADDVDSLVTLGNFSLEGLQHPDGTVLVARNPREGTRCLERAIELGDNDAMNSLASHLSRAGGTASERTRGVALYRRAFRMGNSTAAYNLACTYKEHGRLREAVRWYRRAYAAGDPSAVLDLARAELYGVGTKRNVKAGFAKLQRAARAHTKWWPADRGENVEAMIEIARLLFDGWLVPRDFRAARKWLQRAAEWKSATAKAMLDDY